MMDAERIPPKFADGWHDDVPIEEYHADPALSKTRLSRFAKVPVLAQHPMRETKAQAFGQLTHTAVLEPTKLLERYRRTTLDRRGTKAWDAEEQAAMGRELVKASDFDSALELAASVRAHPTVRSLLDWNSGFVERSLWWTDKDTGLRCRCRPDVFLADEGCMLDLKSCADASMAGFAKNVASYFYDWQAVFYANGLKTQGIYGSAMLFIAVESEPPYLTQVFEISPRDLQNAEMEVREYMHSFAECLRQDKWPAYPEDIQQLSLLPWDINRRKGIVA